MEEEDIKKMSDHDIIVSMHVTLKRAIEDLKALDLKVTEFNNHYIKKEDIEPIIKDHELRLRRLEIWGFTAIGILLALQFYFNFLR